MIPSRIVNEAFRESSSYYFIGFRTTADGSGKEFRKVDVKVNRPGVYVSTRQRLLSAGKDPCRRDVNGHPER